VVGLDKFIPSLAVSDEFFKTNVLFKENMFSKNNRKNTFKKEFSVFVFCCFYPVVLFVILY